MNRQLRAGTVAAKIVPTAAADTPSTQPPPPGPTGLAEEAVRRSLVTAGTTARRRRSGAAIRGDHVGHPPLFGVTAGVFDCDPDALHKHRTRRVVSVEDRAASPKRICRRDFGLRDRHALVVPARCEYALQRLWNRPQSRRHITVGH